MKPFYNTSQELEEACEKYFTECDIGETVQVVRRGKAVDVKKAIPYTVPGLAYALGFAARQSVWDLKQNPVFTDTIRRALVKIENQRVVKALLGEQESRFAQFDLINNSGYTSSKTEVKNTLEITMGDDELKNRLAILDDKLAAVEQRQDAPVIEGEFAVKLL